MIQDDLFAPRIAVFPSASKPETALTPKETKPPKLTHLGVGDRVKSVTTPDGKRYKNGDVLEVSTCRRYVKLHAQRVGAHWFNCMDTFWVTASDCVRKYPRRGIKGKEKAA